MMLPRLHAITDAQVLALPNFVELARRLATLGSRVAIHLRDRTATGRVLAGHATALAGALAGTGAVLFVSARPDIGAAISAHGVQLGTGDLGVGDARAVLRRGWVGRSVHAVEEAGAAARAGADFLVAGSIWATDSHPGLQAQGPGMIPPMVSPGLPVLAIGGVTPARAGEVKEAGAYGVAAIRAIWKARDPAAAAEAMLEPWQGI